jgi:hypothetical protein
VVELVAKLSLQDSNPDITDVVGKRPADEGHRNDYASDNKKGQIFGVILPILGNCQFGNYCNSTLP